MSRAERSVFVVVSGPEAEREELRAFAMAAAVLGVPLRPVNDFVETRRVEDGRETRYVAWYLEQSDASQQQKTNELLRWWRDPKWLAENPTHPLAMMREYWQALRDAAAREKTGLILAAITRGKKHAHIPIQPPISPERKNKILEMLEK